MMEQMTMCLYRHAKRGPTGTVCFRILLSLWLYPLSQLQEAEMKRLIGSG